MQWGKTQLENLFFQKPLQLIEVEIFSARCKNRVFTAQDMLQHEFVQLKVLQRYHGDTAVIKLQQYMLPVVADQISARFLYLPLSVTEVTHKSPVLQKLILQISLFHIRRFTAGDFKGVSGIAPCAAKQLSVFFSIPGFHLF